MNMRIIFVILPLLLALWSAESYHLVVGNIAARTILAHEELVTYNPFPFVKRVKQYFYTSPDNKPIRGIQAIDTLHGKSSINITSGGIGYPFVNMRMKSERGGGLSYNIGIYVSPNYQ